MKILLYTDYYIASGHNGGSEVTAHEMLLLFRAGGHSVEVLMAKPFPDGSDSFVVEGIQVNAYRSKRDIELYMPQYDLVIAHLGTAQRAWYIGLKLGIPVLQLVSNTTEYSTNMALKYGDFLIYNSHNTEASIGSDKPGAVVYPPVDPRRYTVDSTREYITLVNLSDGQPPFFDKGAGVFYALAEQFPDEKFLGVRGAYGEQDIRELPNVTIIDHSMRMLSVYRKTKIVLMPSKTESFGRISVEAATSGIPSLVTNLPGPCEAGTAYEYVDPSNVEAWVGALGRLLGNYETATHDTKVWSADLWTKTQGQFEALLQKVEERYGGQALLA